MFVGEELVKGKPYLLEIEGEVLGIYKCDPLFIVLPYLNSKIPKKMEWK